MLWKIVMFLVGLLLLAYGISQQLLLVAGNTTSATVTGITRESRTTRDSSNRSSTEHYYAVKYAFTASDGSIQSGKFDRAETASRPAAGSTVYIRYLSFYPTINAYGDEVSVGLTGLGMTALGLLILFAGVKR